MLLYFTSIKACPYISLYECPVYVCVVCACARARVYVCVLFVCQSLRRLPRSSLLLSDLCARYHCARSSFT